MVPAPGANPGLVEDCEALARGVECAHVPGDVRSGSDIELGQEYANSRVAGRRDIRRSAPRTEVGAAESGLTGPIPPDLAALAMLVELDLSYNSLTGPIPPELGNLSLLKTLDLSHNIVGSPIPAELGKLAMLTTLDLSYNDLVGPIPAEMGG